MDSQRVIHVVDDDDAVRDSTHFLLEAAGFGVRSHASASEFLRQFEPARSECIVLDLHMPGMSGLELIERLHGRGDAVPVIAVSGRADGELEEFCLRAGAQALLAKPIDDAELVDLIHRVLAAS